MVVKVVMMLFVVLVTQRSGLEDLAIVLMEV